MNIMNKLRLRYIILFFIYVFLLLCFNSCKTITKVETETEYKTDTLFVDKICYDSIYVNDSTVIKEKGDTVYFTKYLTKYKEKVKVKDSIQVKIEYKDKIIEKEVIKKIPIWKNYFLYSTIGLLLFIIMLLRYTKK